MVQQSTETVWPDFLVARFWSYVEKTDGCWLWRGGRFSDGMRYGQFRAGKKKVKAHRFAYELKYGKLDFSIKVLHRCDNPICVRDDHHFTGSDADNMADRGAKGRTKNGSRAHPELWRGEKNPAAKITADIAAEIRHRCGSGQSQSSVAAYFLLSQSQVGNIVRGRCWGGN